MKNIWFTKQTITSFLVSGVLTYILLNTKDFIAKIVIIPFLIFSLSLFLKHIFIIFEKRNISKIMEKVCVIAFFIYYFGFLVYWDYITITSKDYLSFLFSLLAWFGGIFVAYKRYLRLKNK